MVDLDVPSDYTFSPSQATPHLTINHDVAAEVDSSNAFEGPEKLLEVWFAPGPASLPAGVPQNGLKAVSSDTWVDMLDLVSCKILSVIHSDNVDAYLLSESSMFVFPHKIILKTCGTTTLLLGLHRLLRIAAVDAGFPYHNTGSVDDIKTAATPHRVFYSRKNFLFPDKQHGPHRSWKQEVKFLDDMFEGGSAYMVGKMNGDHWYLYITSPGAGLSPAATPEGENGPVPTKRLSKIPTGLATPAEDMPANMNDETLEVLMTDLDPENAKQFYLSHASAVACEQVPSQVQQARQEAHASLGALTSSSVVDGEVDDIFDVDDVDKGTDATTPMTDQALLAESLTTEGHALGTVVSNTCGLSEVYPTSIFPDARIDAYMFAPCGFSANGVVPAPPGPDGVVVGSFDGGNTTSNHSDHYFTVHVTPEPHCSFASFETNVPGGQKGRETADIIEHVVRIFRPGRFSVTLFETKGKGVNPYGSGSGAGGESGNGDSKQRLERIPGYRRIDRIVHDFDDYDLIFRFYEREGWVGDRGARLGEEI